MTEHFDKYGSLNYDSANKLIEAIGKIPADKWEILEDFIPYAIQTEITKRTKITGDERLVYSYFVRIQPSEDKYRIAIMNRNKEEILVFYDRGQKCGFEKKLKYLRRVDAKRLLRERGRAIDDILGDIPYE